jgi:hypothetical protein
VNPRVDTVKLRIPGRSSCLIKARQLDHSASDDRPFFLFWQPPVGSQRKGSWKMLEADKQN